MWFFDGFVGEAITLVIIAAIGFWLISQGNLLFRLIGGIFCLLGLVQLLRSPSVLAAIALAALAYVVFLVVRAIRRARVERRAAATPFCARCGHASHPGACPNCGCRR
jgi:threonine/homoserine/homoserine lactone efflux protein